MFKVNPYRPGAGFKPPYLAGRDDEIERANNFFEALTMNVPVQSIIYSGLRGVGKTVLINKLCKDAENKGIFCRHIEVEIKNDFISQIASCSQMFLREVSAVAKIKNLAAKAINAIKSLVISFDPDKSTFSFSLEEKELYQSNNLTQSLTEVFTNIGEIAYELNVPICFFIDEIQYMKKEELGSLVAALHRANQLGYPIMIIGAGLPKIYKMLSDEKTYSERLFVYKEIDSLDYEQSKAAIIEPVKNLKIVYDEDAVDKIIDITKGYPFFIQQLCKIIYENLDKSFISVDDVNKAVKKFYISLDSGFFKVRYERCSDSDKKFIFAMVKSGELPCTIANVSNILGKKVKKISPTRAQLINKGIIYSVRYSELDFTVPEFSGFISRLEEYKQWCDSLI